MQAQRSKRFMVFTIAVLLAVGQVPLLAAPAQETRISGRVFDRDLVSPVVALTVQAIPDGGKTPVATTATDAKGRFQLLDIPAGSYVLVLRNNHGEALAAAKVAANAGEKKELTLALPDRKPGEGSEAPAAAGAAVGAGGFFTTAAGATVIVVASAVVLSAVAHKVVKNDEKPAEVVSPTVP